MIRLIKEWLKPELKCQRVGHNYKQDSIRIRKNSHKFYASVIDYSATVDRCTRCHHRTEPRDEKEIDYFTSCTMPRSYWERIESKGYVEI